MIRASQRTSLARYGQTKQPTITAKPSETAMADHQTYYVPEQSKWPIIATVGMGVTLYGAASIMVNGNQGESTTGAWFMFWIGALIMAYMLFGWFGSVIRESRSEEHTSELQSRENLVCRLLLEKKKKKYKRTRQN